MSRLVLAQKGNLQKIENALAELDFAKAVLALRLAILFMHSRAEFDFSRLHIKMKNKIEIEAKKKSVLHHPSVSCWLGKEADYWADVGVPFIVRGE